MKKIYIVLLIFVIIQLLGMSCFSYDDYFENSMNIVIDSVDEETEQMLSKIGFDDYSFEELYQIDFSDIADLLLSIFKGSLKIPFSSSVTVAGISLMCFTGQNFTGKNKTISVFLETVSLIFISLFIYSSISGLINRAVTSVLSVGTMMKVLVPVLAAVVTFSGNPSLALSYNAVTLYVSEIITAVSRDFLIPFLLIFVALSGCLAFNGLVRGELITNTVKRIVNTILGLAGTVFTGFITVKDVLACGIDKVSVKGIKFLIGSSVPVVGSALSEGLSSVIASVSLMKNTFGIIGIIILIIIVLPVVSELICWILSMYFCEYICEIFEQKKNVAMLSSLRFSFSLILSVILFTVYILIVSTGLVILMGSK